MMPALSDSPRLRLVFLCVLYVAQGLPFGFVTVGLRDFLHAQGVAEAETGAMIAMVGIPWTFKFLWGPVIDRWGFRAMGKRRPWLLLAQGMMVTMILLIALLPSLRADIGVLGISILVLNLFIALQDVSTDSLAVDLVSEEQRGRANGFMYGSSYLGSFCGALIAGRFLPGPERDGSVATAFLVLAALVFLIMWMPLLLRERAGEKLLPGLPGSSQLTEEEAPADSIRELFSLLVGAFRRPVAIFAAIFAVFAYLTGTMLSVVGSKFFVAEVGWTSAEYTSMQAFAMWFSFGGSAVGGILVDRIGSKRGILVSGTLLALTWIAFRYCGEFYESRPFVTGLSYLQAALIGFMAASMFSLFMSIANKRVGATQFTAYMALLNLSIVMGGKLTGPAVEWIPSAPDLYLACGIFHLFVMGYCAIAIRPPADRSVE